MITRDELIKKYADLFDGPHAYPTCGDGWLPIIETFFELIRHDIKWNNMPPVKIIQIKEKFGTLRIYHNGGNDKLLAYEMFASGMSDKMCEVCGTTKNVGRTHDWIQTICGPCFEAWANSEASKIRYERVWVPNIWVLK
jgi:hypothetical protein